MFLRISEIQKLLLYQGIHIPNPLYFCRIFTQNLRQNILSFLIRQFSNHCARSRPCVLEPGTLFILFFCHSLFSALTCRLQSRHAIILMFLLWFVPSKAMLHDSLSKCIPCPIAIMFVSPALSSCPSMAYKLERYACGTIRFPLVTEPYASAFYPLPTFLSPCYFLTK